MKLENLVKCFNTAKEENYKYVGVAIVNEEYDGVEIIINSSENFDNKLDYYLKAYDDNLTLKAYNKIKILGFTFGNTFNSIADDLLGHK